MTFLNLYKIGKDMTFNQFTAFEHSTDRIINRLPFIWFLDEESISCLLGISLVCYVLSKKSSFHKKYLNTNI